MVQRDVRRAVAGAVRRDDGLVLAVRRPDEPGEELPGVWGLPAVTLREGEAPEEGVRRLGREKLGAELTPLRPLAEGEQQREGYTLRMTVYEASLAGEPHLPPRPTGTSATLYEAIDWLPASSFQEAADRGSLCCRLLLETLIPGPSPASGRRERRELGTGQPAGPRRPKIAPRTRARLTASARAMRSEPTKSEDLLWQALRNRKLQGRKFRRQHRIGAFVVDFYCSEENLVIEVDGPVHQERQAEDQMRQGQLEQLGLRILRLKAEEVERDVEAALRKIRAALLARDIPLSRSRERGRG